MIRYFIFILCALCQMDTQNDSKFDFWPRQLGSKFSVFTRALLFSNGRSLQTQKFAPLPCQKSNFESFCVYAATKNVQTPEDLRRLAFFQSLFEAFQNEKQPVG